MKKSTVRIFAIVLAGLMILSLLPLAYARAEEYDPEAIVAAQEAAQAEQIAAMVEAMPDTELTEPTCGRPGYVSDINGVILEVIPATGAHVFESVVNDDYLIEKGANYCLDGNTYWKSCININPTDGSVCGVPAEEAYEKARQRAIDEFSERHNSGEEHTDAEWTDMLQRTLDSIWANYTFKQGGEGHVWVSVDGQEATCTNDGWKPYRMCSVCGEVADYEAKPATGHRWGEFVVVTEPTCEDDGLRKHVCEICGLEETEAIPALGHKFGAFSVIKAPTCTEDGEQEHICAVCDKHETEAIPALGHKFGAFSVTKAPTCTVDGEQEHTCTVCGFKETELIPAAHKFGEFVVTEEPGCYSSGTQERTCSVCGEKEQESIPAAHKYGEFVVTMEPTCYSTGERRSTCTVCGDEIVEWIDPAHKYENGVCVFCGEAEPDYVAPAENENDTNPEAEPEAKPEDEPETEPETNPETEPETVPETEPAAEVYTGEVTVAQAAASEEVNDSFTNAAWDYLGLTNENTVGVSVQNVTPYKEDGTELSDEEIPAEGITFEMDIPEGFDPENQDIEIYHRNKDGVWEKMQVVSIDIEANKVVVRKVRSFSPFALVVKRLDDQIAFVARPASEKKEDEETTLSDSETFESGTAPGPFAVYLDKNGGSGSLTSPVIKAKGATMTLPTYGQIYRQDHTLQGWNTRPDGSGTHYGPGATYTFYEDETLYAEWDIRVVYHPNGGKGASMVSTPVSGENVELSENTYTRDGYVFFGWNTDPNAYSAMYVDKQNITAPKQDLLLYAQWAKSPLKISFEANAEGVTGTMPTYNVTWGNSQKLAPNAFIHGEKTFVNWNTKDDGTGDSYEDEATIPAETFKEDTILYAQWSKTIFKVTFNINTGDSGSMPEQTIDTASETSLTLNENKFTKAGHTFDGWNTQADGNGDSYTDKQSIPATDFDKNLILYAQWRKNKVTVKFDPNTGDGGETMEDQTIDTTSETSLTLNENRFTKTGYTFSSWNTAGNGSGTTYADKASIPASELTKDITLYAQWATAILFDGNGATSGSMAPQEFDIDPPEDITLNANKFVKTNYKFKSWNTKADGTGTSYPDKGSYSTAAGGVTLYAQWEQSAYAVSYDPNGGGGSMPADNVTVGQSVKLKDSGFTPKPGQIFAGWNTEKDGSGDTYAAGESYQPEDDITMYAQWKDIVKVNYHPDVDDSTYKTVEIPAETDTKVKLPTDEELNFPTPSGKTFAYWTDTTPDSETANHYAKNDTLNITGDIHLYAVYADTVYLTYNANGGTLTTSSGTKETAKDGVPKDESYTLYTAAQLRLTRKGYEFKGWGMTTSDKTVDYADGATAVFSHDTEIFAIWEKHTFDGGVTISGSVSGSSPDAYVNETLTAYPYDDFWKEFNYKWMRSDGKELGTESTYVVKDEDFGFDIYCEVTAVGDDSGTVKKSNVKNVVVQVDSKPKRIVNNGQTEIDYVYGLTKDMTYTINSADPSKAKTVTLDSEGRMPLKQAGTYRFYSKDGTLVATVNVENWFTVGYAASGSGTVRLFLDTLSTTSQLTGSTNFSGNEKTKGNIEYYNKVSGYTCWIVKEGADVGTFTLTVTPASSNYAHVYLNGSVIDSFGSGTTAAARTTTSSGSSGSSGSSSTASTASTITRSYSSRTPLTTWKMYEVTFTSTVNTSPRTADESRLGLWAALCFGSMTGAAVLLSETRKRRKSAK